MLPPKHADEENRLAALYRYGMLDTAEEQSFDEITHLVADLCDAPIAVINLIDRDRQWFKSEIGLGVRQTPLDISICAHAILESELFEVTDTEGDERFVCNPLVTGDPHLRFYAGAQLQSSDGYPLGTLCVLDYKPRVLTQAQKSALAVLSRQVMSQMELRLLVNQQAQYLEERRLAHELLSLSESKHRHIAETLQSALLLPPPADKFPGLTVGTHYQGAWQEAEVAGDFFDAFALDAGIVALILGDVTGKGLAAAAYTAEVKFALRAFLRDLSEPAQAMTRLNHYLIESRRQDRQGTDGTLNQYVALIVAIVDTVKGEVCCAGAGGEPPLLVRANGSYSEMDVYGTMLGVDAASTYETVAFPLESGDLLVLTTDGITEARRRGPVSRGSDLFGYERFTMAAVEASGMPSPTEIAQAISAAALDFSGGAQADDICLLVARFK